MRARSPLTFLAALAVLAAASSSLAQNAQRPQATGMQQQQLPYQQTGPQGGGELSVTGKVVQTGAACIGCATPEVRFCLTSEQQARTCAAWFVFSNPSKDDVRAVYAAILTAITADKWVTAAFAAGGAPREIGWRALSGNTSPASARSTHRVVLAVEK